MRRVPKTVYPHRGKPYEIEVIEACVFFAGRKRSTSYSIPRYGVAMAKNKAIDWAIRTAREMRNG